MTGQAKLYFQRAISTYPTELQSVLTQLKSDDESLQLDALNQLNELLAVSMADSLGLYPVEQLIPVLVMFLCRLACWTALLLCSWY